MILEDQLLLSINLGRITRSLNAYYKKYNYSSEKPFRQLPVYTGVNIPGDSPHSEMVQCSKTQDLYLRLYRSQLRPKHTPQEQRNLNSYSRLQEQEQRSL
ncbi:hypothetical protein ATANTOWER_014815 [Ataeniobius toweri]|uniref:Uncharacterized protein n=1 Tax=Ataeniobius toweri TaxID=208326 RepID=A0ABU7AFI4_9TELE|nr:hypothetical protein [Ataeniobius toweri]